MKEYMRMIDEKPWHIPGRACSRNLVATLGALNWAQVKQVKQEVKVCQKMK